MTGRRGAALLCAVALLGACDEQRPEALIRVTNESTAGTVWIQACRGHCTPCPRQCVTHDGGPDGTLGDAGGNAPDLDASVIPDTSRPEECPDDEGVSLGPNETKIVAVFAEDAAGRDQFYLRYSCKCGLAEEVYGNLNIDIAGFERPVRFDVALGCDGPPECSGDVDYCL
jgi:hypothetical protein